MNVWKVIENSIEYKSFQEKDFLSPLPKKRFILFWKKFKDTKLRNHLLYQIV